MTRDFYEEENETYHTHNDLSHNHMKYEPENYTDTENISDEETYHIKPLYELGNDVKEPTPVVQYTVLQIGITNLIISSNGRIRKSNDVFTSSIGYSLPGTPYRTYPVEISKNKIEEYYVHDLVWRAFNGDPPEGYEVRHNFWIPKNNEECYDNSLENLEIYKTSVVYLPSNRKTLPSPILN